MITMELNTYEISTVVPYAHIGCLYCEGGGTPDKHGALKVVLQ